MTRPFKVLSAAALVALVLLAWRFVMGLGATTNLSDGYPWGIWITFEMVVGTALAAGGYAMALLVYVMNRGRYHPLVRSALLTGALGYTLGGIAVIVDLGRYWATWKLPVMAWRWNLDSILLEVAVCVMLYTLVLWVEVSPAFLERLQAARRPRLRVAADTALAWLRRSLPWLIALGLLLPTMHQSSLGSLMLLAGAKLHPLWNTPLLPLLFLVSCLAMGFAAVVMESLISSVAFGRQRDTALLSRLGVVAAGTLMLFVGIRLIDVAARGRLALAVEGDAMSVLFWTEIALFAAPVLLLSLPGRVARAGRLFRAAMLVAAAGVLYRFSVYLLAFNPGPQWSYFPGLQEMLITVGLVSLEVMAYLTLVKRFPVLAGAPTPAAPLTVQRAPVAVTGISLDLATTTPGKRP